MSFRTYRDVTGTDRSGLGEQVEAQRARIAARLSRVRATVAVMSGKGGVGKTYVTAALALGSCRARRWEVGVLDADLRSPTLAGALGVEGPVVVSEDGVHPVRSADGVRVMSSALLLEEGTPLTWREHSRERFVWRGVLETGALREFLGDVVWGDLDLLLVDLAPGADRLSDLAEVYPALAGAIAVTIPSDDSYASVRRSMRAAVRARIPLLGVVENMRGYACGACLRTQPLFAGDAGARLSQEFGVPLLAQLPFRAGPGTAAPDFTNEALLGDALGALAALRPAEGRAP